MAKLKDILETELSRNDSVECRKIHLFPEGTFLRAYEWSAWLCVMYISDFKPTKRKFKSEDAPAVFVGFPQNSLERHTPEGAEVTVMEDKSIELLLPETLFRDTTDAQLLKTDFENWKQSVPLTVSSRKDLEVGGRVDSSSHPGRLTDIMHRILAWPIEQKSPMESMLFLADIKRSIADII